MSSDLVRRTLVVRQAIYDATRSVVGFELLFRCDTIQDCGSEPGSEPGSEQGVSQLIASTFGAFDIQTIADGRPVFVNFTRAFVTGVIQIPLDPADVVVEIGTTMVADHELVLGLQSLAQAGYRIALSGYRGDVSQARLLALADFVAIDVNACPGALLAQAAATARSGGATLLATGIEDAATLKRCAEMGFELFQGPYLQRPSVLEGKTLSPIQLVCVRLLNLLADEETSTKQLEQLVGSDPGLSMRLLRTANSASSGVRAEITSLHHAIVMLGPRRLRAWVVLTLLEGGVTRSRTDELWSILARAFACRRLAPDEAELAYTVGLLSGCADLLGVEAAEVATGAGVGAQTRAALLDGAGQAGAALTAVLAHEADDADALARTGLVPFEVSRAYLTSLGESLTVVHGLSET